ncbi:DUF2306 domain-containing protein [Bosea sp. LjRoot90]|uniref:DUF2306 domain-containing protein n=1 Tax=Bosea sp. LjRoot90 TaxID=3342342 RepID=UPI003ECC8E83
MRNLSTVRRVRPGAVVAALIIAILVAPTTGFAIAIGSNLLPLPDVLLLVRQKLPLAFPLHMIASGLALIFIAIAAATRHRRGVHRAAGRIAALCVLIGGLTALPVALASEAGLVAQAGFFVQGIVWLSLLVAALIAIRIGHAKRHARLMMAMAAVASGAIWLRVAVWFAVALQLPFEASYAIAAWAAWLLPLGLALLLGRSGAGARLADHRPQHRRTQMPLLRT